MIYTVFEKNIKYIKSTQYAMIIICIVLVMIFILCFDYIIMMSRFVELYQGII